MCATARTSSLWPGKGGGLNPISPHEHPRLPSDCSTDSAWSAGAVIRAGGPFSWSRCARSPSERQKGRILFPTCRVAKSSVRRGRSLPLSVDLDASAACPTGDPQAQRELLRLRGGERGHGGAADGGAEEW